MARLACLGGEPVRRDPWPTWPQHGPEVRAAIERVAASNCYHPQFGGENEAFEKAFAAYHGVRHAVAVASGTHALIAAMSAAGVGCGDEVVAPAYTYVASAAAAVEQNAVAVFADSEPLSQGIDAADAARKITERTKAIVAVHPNGYPCDMDAVVALADKHGLVVIEDCSHAHGARYKGRKVGTLGHLGAFSIQHKKNFSAGVGGVVITDDDAMAEKMRDDRNYGWTRVGHNWHLSEFHAAIAAAQVPMLDAMNRRRRENVAVLLEALGEVEGITPLAGLPETEAAYYNLILQYDESLVGAPRKVFVDALKAEGIPIHMFYVPLQDWPVFAASDFYGRGCPFACPLRGAAPVDYAATATPVAEAICHRINLEIKVQPTSGPLEMAQTAEAIAKIIDNRDELARIESA